MTTRQDLINETLEKLLYEGDASHAGAILTRDHVRCVLEQFAATLLVNRVSVLAEDLAWLRETCLGWSFDPWATAEEETRIAADVERATRLFDALQASEEG